MMHMYYFYEFVKNDLRWPIGERITSIHRDAEKRSTRKHREYKGIKRAGDKPRPSLASGFVCSPALTTTLHLPSRGSGLVDLLIARRGRLRANLDRGVDLIELEVVYLPVDLGEV